MKLLTSLVLFVTIVGAAFAQDTGKATVLNESFGQAVGKQDMSKVDDLLADKVTIYWIHKKFYGKASFDKYLKGQYASFDHHLLSFNAEGGIEDETMSTSWGTFMFSYGKTGQNVSSQLLGRYTVIATEVDGKWRIIALHLSLPYPPNAPDDDTIIGHS